MAPSFERVVRRGDGLAVRRGIAQQRLLGLQCHVLPGVVEGGAVDLGDLETQEVELAGTGARVAAQGIELGDGCAHLGTRARRSRERVECRCAGEMVEGGALHRWRQK